MYMTSMAVRLLLSSFIAFSFLLIVLINWLFYKISLILFYSQVKPTL